MFCNWCGMNIIKTVCKDCGEAFLACACYHGDYCELCLETRIEEDQAAYVEAAYNQDIPQ